MNTKIFYRLLLMFSVTAIFLSSCGSKTSSRTKTEAVSQDVYTCSMHPQVVEHHPGDCPICGMKLIKKNPEAASTNNIQLESLLKPANQFVVASLSVTTPQQKNMSLPIEAYGTIEYDTKAAGSISARISGRIEKLYLRYRYQEVQAGQKIMDIYSPELVTAEQNLLFLIKSDADNISFINAAKEKLLLLGMSESELNKVIETGKPLYSVSVYSKYSGHVHDAGMNSNATATDMNNNENVTRALSLKEGMYVNKGQTLFMIMNHHQVWAALQIFPDEQSIVKKGDDVTIIPETDTNAVINGTIDFIEPFFRSNSKTLTARVYFHNMQMLPVGSHVSAKINSENVQGMWLPSTSVVSLGGNDVAFLKKDGGFIAHQITTGLRADNNIQVISGLSITDSVATNAQYLIDSESFITTSSN